MTVLILERVPTSLRGHLTRWLLEVRAGVFVGTVSARVRDHLWALTTERAKKGSALLIHPARTEQGFAIRSHGDPSRQLIDMEGLLLVRRPAPAGSPTSACPEDPNSCKD